jgi:hypothetical protein
MVRISDGVEAGEIIRAIGNTVGREISVPAVTHEKEYPCAAPTGTDVTYVSFQTRRATLRGVVIVRDTWTR